MSRFSFRFEPLQRLREAARDERRALLGDALRVEAELNRQQQELDTLLRENRDAMTAKPGMVNIDQLVDAERYALVLLMQRQQLALQQAKVAQEVEERRAALVEADREVRVLEKLKETQAERFETDARRREQRDFDEVAGVGHERKRREAHHS